MNPDLPGFIRLRLKMLRLAALLFMVTETILAVIWPLLLWLCTFFSLWLFQIPGIFGTFAEVLTAIVFIGGVFIFSYRAITNFKFPNISGTTHRIEEDSNLHHRPLSGLNDALANPENERTKHLWSLWRNNLIPTLRLLRWPRLRPVLIKRDPYALRGLAIMAVIVAMVIAGPTWRARLHHGLVPVMPSFMKTKTDDVVLWITPPAYTGQGQIVLKGKAAQNEKPVTVPEGSIIKARVNGWLGQPSLRFDQISFPMKELGKRSYGIENTAQEAKTISIHQFFITRLSWPIAYVIDHPPTVTQKGEPQIQGKGEIKIPLTVKDDYGVETVTAHITLDPSVTPPPIGTPVDDVRNITSPPNVEMDFTPQFDLAWHPWAGLKVLMDIEAKDHKGQTARIEDFQITLPERHFRHPLAKKLIDMRKRLIWAPQDAAMNIANDVLGIMVRPKLYQGDKIVFLSLRSIVTHLASDNSSAEVAKVVAHLWDTALRVEDGNFTMAQRELRNAQAALQNALRDPTTTPAQIAALIDNVRQAMAEYLQEIFREMQKQMADNGADPNMISPESFMRTLNPDALAAMLDKMQAQALSGDRNAAQKMLSQMQNLMESLDPSSIQGKMPQDVQDMAEQINKMQEIIDSQKALLEKTRKLINDKSKDQQEDIRKNLNALMQDAAEKLGDIPEGMGKAELQMRDSSKALGDNQLEQSIPHQEQAIKDLSESQEQMSQKLGQRLQQMMMFSFGSGPTDPLGRPMGDGTDDGNGEGSKVKIPDQAERRKIQEILEQLRKKSSDLSRPDYELDYYRRLMRQF